jgi:DNA-binding FadR family transcriptional regulator
MTQSLGRAIVCGEYNINESLPSEAVLCEDFGVSRTAVREAVKMLSAKGLISSRQRQGIRILPEEEWNILDPDLLRWSLESNPSLRVLKEFLQMRIAIEPEAAALAARNASPERIAVVREALDRMDRARGKNAEEALEADIDFHISILYASENRFFIRMRDFTRTALNVSIRHTNLIKSNPAGIVADHAEVLTAIENRDPVKARQSMFELIDEALSFIDSELESQKQ